MGKQSVLGIDIGTTGTKSILFDLEGNQLFSTSQGYPTAHPQNGWSEQDPEDWWEAVRDTVGQIMAYARAKALELLCVGVTGQFQSLVMLDADGRVLRPAILWSDQRSSAQHTHIENKVGLDSLLRITANADIMGSTLASLLWVRENEPSLYEACRHILLPNDYIRWRLSGVLATDVTNASSMQLLDVPERQWSQELLKLFDIPRELLPPVFESTEIIGRVSQEAAQLTGLLPATPLVACAGDTVAATVGSGATEPGMAYTALGTSGLLCMNTRSVKVDPTGSINTYCSALPGMWTLISCLPAAGLSLEWLRTISFHPGVEGPDPSANSFKAMDSMAAAVPAGAEGLLFLPYLTGVRTPYLDPEARGSFVGLNDIHGRSHLVRAVLEGVAFGMRSCLDSMRSEAAPVKEMVLCGGGASSPLWRGIIADVYGMAIATLKEDEVTALGAAILAAVGVGAWDSVGEAVENMVHKEKTHAFDPDKHRTYTAHYALFKGLYPALKDTFSGLQAL